MEKSLQLRASVAECGAQERRFRKPDGATSFDEGIDSPHDPPEPCESAALTQRTPKRFATLIVTL